MVHIINGVCKDFKGITTGVCTRETTISFNELYEKLVDYEAVLKRKENVSSTSPITANATVK